MKLYTLTFALVLFIVGCSSNDDSQTVDNAGTTTGEGTTTGDGTTTGGEQPVEISREPDHLFRLVSGEVIPVTRDFTEKMFVDKAPLVDEDVPGFTLIERTPAEGQPETVRYACDGGGEYVKPGTQQQRYTLHTFSDCVIADNTYNGVVRTEYDSLYVDDFSVSQGGQTVFSATGSVSTSFTTSGNFTSKFWSFENYQHSLSDTKLTNSSVSETYSVDSTTDIHSLTLTLQLTVQAPWTGGRMLSGSNSETLFTKELSSRAEYDSDTPIIYDTGSIILSSDSGDSVGLDADNGDPDSFLWNVDVDNSVTSNPIDWLSMRDTCPTEDVSPFELNLCK